ncbi:phosphatidylserine decarboxylase [Halenospora varia]|nr:phosphatidylserine decarboxylase [Halenospora varia]
MATVKVHKPNSPYFKHRLGGWMPSDPQHWRKWLGDTVDHVRKHHQKERAQLHKSVQALWLLIETDTQVRMLFNMMLEQVPTHAPYNTNPAGGPEFTSWKEMLLTFDWQLTQGPLWVYNTEGEQGLIGFPFNAFLDWPMGTPAGIFAFLRQDINKCLRDMINEYGDFLKSDASTKVLNKNPEGWFNDTALSVMVNVAVPGGTSKPSFFDIFECEPTHETFGFSSWDAFFIRKFKDNVRPIYMPNDDKYITNCCESHPHSNVKISNIRDEFWLKGQPYSLSDMLSSPADARPFVGGKIYQAFLSSLSYHCWHAPVSGIAKKIINIPGSYYAENYWEGFPNIDASGKPDPDPAAPNNSQSYICQVAARSVMFLEADNPNIGLMAIVMVGMAEVSTTEWYVKEGQHFSKGDLIGAFHFGGSTHCLIFRPGVKLDFVSGAQPPFPETEDNLPVRGLLATVKN